MTCFLGPVFLDNFNCQGKWTVLEVLLLYKFPACFLSRAKHTEALFYA